MRGKQGCEVFRTAYIYTNYTRYEVATADYGSDINKPKIFIAKNKMGKEFVLDPYLKTEYLPRVDYGNLGRADIFQRHLMQEFNNYFELTQDDQFEGIMKKLRRKGFVPNKELTKEIIVNATFNDFDQLKNDIFMNGADAEVRVSRNDVEKSFTQTCADLLREQTDDDAKVSNIARSWSPLKSAVRMWLKKTFIEYGEDDCYRIFINDVRKKDHSTMRAALTHTLKSYRPNLLAQLKERQEQALKTEAVPFKVLETYAYTDDYEPHNMQRCILSPFYIRTSYDGRITEWSFAQYLDASEKVEWWLKNGDSGKDYFSIRYTNSEKGILARFFPDWIVRLKDGRIGIFDTKGGITAASQDTKDKAEELQRRIKYLNSLNREQRFIGGIICKFNGLWYLQNLEHYTYNPNNTDGWIL
ncbi:MAG: hypothetical protein J1F40_05185 [Prevotellaceae bacterium]|nr:hypothetical protein [Prevotellaceae bacterium]